MGSGAGVGAHVASLPAVCCPLQILNSLSSVGSIAVVIKATVFLAGTDWMCSPGHAAEYIVFISPLHEVRRTGAALLQPRHAASAPSHGLLGVASQVLLITFCMSLLCLCIAVIIVTVGARACIGQLASCTRQERLQTPSPHLSRPAPQWLNTSRTIAIALTAIWGISTLAVILVFLVVFKTNLMLLKKHVNLGAYLHANHWVAACSFSNHPSCLT